MRRLAALLLLAALPAAAQQPERRTLEGEEIAIYNLAGRMRVVRGTGSGVTVEIQRRGPEARELRIETGPLRGRSTLRVVYPADRIYYDEMDRGSRTQLRVRRDGTFGDGMDRGEGERVEISGRDGGLEAHADLTVAVPPGKSARFYLAVGDVSLTNVDGNLLVDVAAASVTARGVKGTLRLDTGSGEVSIADATGDLDLDTGSGSVTLERVKGGKVNVDAGSGSVTGTGIDVTELVVDIGSGETRLRDVRAHDLRIDSGSGGVDVALTGAVRSMVIDTGSGEVTLRVPETLGAEIDIDSGSGGIDSELPITVYRRARDHISGRIGDGGGRIRIDTGSGGVRIVRGR
jgi:hypothetical protein